MWGAVLFQQQYRIATTGNEMASVHPLDSRVPRVDLTAGNADALAGASGNLSEPAIDNSQAWPNETGVLGSDHLLE